MTGQSLPLSLAEPGRIRSAKAYRWPRRKHSLCDRKEKRCRRGSSKGRRPFLLCGRRRGGVRAPFPARRSLPPARRRPSIMLKAISLRLSVSPTAMGSMYPSCPGITGWRGGQQRGAKEKRHSQPFPGSGLFSRYREGAARHVRKVHLRNLREGFSVRIANRRERTLEAVVVEVHFDHVRIRPFEDTGGYSPLLSVRVCFDYSMCFKKCKEIAADSSLKMEHIEDFEYGK